MRAKIFLPIGIVVLVLSLMNSLAWADVPKIINYQGKLTDNKGIPLTGIYYLSFSLYKVQTGGSLLWNEVQEVYVQEGIYNIQLGSVKGFGEMSTNPFENQALYLEIGVATDIDGTDIEIMIPRKRITSVGYAFRAAISEGVTEGGVTSAMIQNNAITGSHIEDNAVSASKIASGAVTSAHISNEDVTISGSINIEGNNGIIAKGPFGDVRAWDNISTAVQNNQTNEITLLISNEEQVNMDLTIPDNIALCFLRSGSLNVAKDTTVTINGVIEAGLYQIFNGEGRVLLVTQCRQVYPQWFGAKFDGFIDDQVSINKAISSMSPGGLLKLVGDTFISDSINITKSLTISGLGRPKITQTAAAKKVFAITANNVLLENLHIYGEGSFNNSEGPVSFGDSICIGDNLRPVSHVVIRNCYLENFGDYAVIVDGDSKASPKIFISDVTINNCKIIGTDENNLNYQGIRVENCERITVKGCDISHVGICYLATGRTSHTTISGCNLHDTSIQHGVYISGGTEHTVITGCQIHDCAATGIKSSGPQMVITGNEIHNNGSWGINLKADLNDIIISGNTIVENGDDGIDAGFEDANRSQVRITITGNTISNNCDHGINFPFDYSGCVWQDIVISNNTVAGNCNTGIHLPYSHKTDITRDNVAIVGNIVRKNGDSGIHVGGYDAVNDDDNARNILIANNVLVDNYQDGYADTHAQLYCRGVRGLTIEGNIIAALDSIVYAGAYLKYVTDYYYTDNIISGHSNAAITEGIAVTGNGVQTITSNYTITQYDRIIRANTSNDSITVTLPKPETIGFWGTITIKKIHAGNTLNVYAGTDSSIDDGNQSLIANKQFVTLVGHKKTWYIIAEGI